MNTTNNTDNKISIRIINDLENLLIIKKEWNELVVNSNATIYQTHEWIYYWWYFYNHQTENKLYCILIYSDDKLIGIAPLYLNIRSFVKYKFDVRLKLIGNGNANDISFGFFGDDGVSDYLDILLRTGYEDVATKELVNHLLNSDLKIDQISLLNVRPDSRIYNHLLPYLRKINIIHSMKKADICPYLNIPTNMDDFFGSLSTSVRRRFNQSWKAAKEGSLFKISRASTLDVFKKNFNEMIALHQQRWNRMGYPGLFADIRYKQFQLELLPIFFANGWLWCKTAIGDTQTIACRYGFIFNNVFYDYLSGINESSLASKRRPGIVLLIEMLDDAIKAGGIRLDLLRGDEPYKFDFTQVSQNNWYVKIKIDSHNNFLYRFINIILKTIDFLIFMINKEIKLYKIQQLNYKFPRALITFIKFRSPRLVKKIRKFEQASHNY